MMRNHIQALTHEQIQRIHALSLELLEKKGYIFHSQEAIDVFKAQGAQVSGKFVKIPQNLMAKYLSSCPSSFTWKGRGSSLLIGQGQEHCWACQNHGPVSIHDPSGKRRDGTLDDVANFYKLGQSGKYTGVVGQVSVDPVGLPSDKKDALIARELLRHTDKPLMSYPMAIPQANNVFSMVKSLMGEDYLDNNHAICASVCSLSPLQYSEESCETILWYARNKQILMFMSGAMFGITGPMNYTHSLILQNVENLAGIALAQAVCPGLPVIYGSLGTVSNMYSGVSLVGDPDSNRVNKASLELAQHVYNIPTRSITTGTDAKILDMQAGYESMQNNLLMMLGGTNLMNECFGVLDSMLGISYEKYIIDEEIFSRSLRIGTSLEIKDEDLSIDSLMDISELTTFLLDDATLEGCRDLWKPTVSVRDDYEMWQSNGEKTVVDKAQEIVYQRLLSAPSSMLSAEEERNMSRFVD